MRSPTRIVGIAAFALILMAAAASKPTTIPASKIGNEVVVLGRLQLPVGEQITIRGQKKVRLPLQDVFEVETVNGKPAQPDTIVQITGMSSWPDGTSATLRGYEVGTLRFLHLDETNYSGEHDPRWKGPHQKLFLRFAVSAVVEPAGLELATER